MAKYITFEIYNAEPIKVSSTVMQSDSEYTKSFIPGSAIRGAFISNYIIQQNINDLNEGAHRERLLKDRIRFYNAYPYKGSRSWPMPLGYYALKADMKKTPSPKFIEISRNTDVFKGEQYDSVKSCEFCSVDISNKSLKCINVEKENNMHISKGYNNSETKLFRYEALSKGQCFNGMIFCKQDDDAKLVGEILSKGTFYLGGSKDSGYGLCRIKKVRVYQNNPIIEDFFDEEDTIVDEFEDVTSIYLYALSDILFRGKSYKYESLIDSEFVKDSLGLDQVHLEDASTQCESVTSFNNKWGYRTPVINAIKKGSIFKYSIKGEIEEDNLLKLINEGIGERKNEGYGQVMILPELSFTRITAEEHNADNLKFDKNMSMEESNQLQMIMDRLYMNKLNNDFYRKVLEVSSKMEPYKGRIKKNQWGKLMRLMCNLEGQNYDDGMKHLKEYFNHISDKKNNTELKNALKSIKIDNNNLSDFIIKFLKVETMEQVEAENSLFVRIGNMTSKISGEKIYQYRLNILKEAFRLQTKGSEK